MQVEKSCISNWCFSFLQFLRFYSILLLSQVRRFVMAFRILLRTIVFYLQDGFTNVAKKSPGKTKTASPKKDSEMTIDAIQPPWDDHESDRFLVRNKNVCVSSKIAAVVFTSCIRNVSWEGAFEPVQRIIG